MIYLDYSATTPCNKEVMDSFIKATFDYIGNPNSLHYLGLVSRKVMRKSEEIVRECLNLKDNDIIYTSSATEANNMAIKGIALKYQNRGKHIITTHMEHSSVIETCNYLESIGFIIDYVDVDENGKITLDSLKKVIRDDTILVSIQHVNSEVGIKQDIEKIGEFLKSNYPKVFFHVDGTQSIGKISVNLDNIDLFVASSHKFYGLKGIAVLIKKKNINIVPLIHGGKSQTDYRSGTPTVALMVSLAKALRLALTDLDEKYNHVLNLNQYLKNEIKNIDGVIINSNENCIPHILNISIPTIKAEVMLHALEQEEIYVSTKTACSKDSDASTTLMTLNKDIKVASTSLRISLSHLTTKEEIDKFLNILKIKIKELNLKNE